MSDGVKTFLALGVITALFFFTPRRSRGNYLAHPASPATKAMGVVLLLLLALGAVLGVVRDALVRGGR